MQIPYVGYTTYEAILQFQLQEGIHVQMKQFLRPPKDGLNSKWKTVILKTNK